MASNVARRVKQHRDGIMVAVNRALALFLGFA